MKFSIKCFFSKCDQIHRSLRIWSHLLKKSLMGNLHRKTTYYGETGNTSKKSSRVWSHPSRQSSITLLALKISGRTYLNRECHRQLPHLSLLHEVPTLIQIINWLVVNGLARISRNRFIHFDAP